MSSSYHSSSSLNRRATASSVPTTSTPTSKSHNNRGHPLFRATRTSSNTVSFPLRLLRYTQGWTTVVTAVGVFYTARAESIYFVVGALVTSTIAKILKTIIRDPRPDASAVTRTFGLPSTHSTTVTFMCSYLVIHLLHPILSHAHTNGKGSHVLSSLSPLDLATTLFLIVFPPTVMWSRVALGVHTPRQVVAGGLLGLVCAAGWWTLWTGVVPFDGHHLAQGWNRHWLAAEVDGLIRKYKRLFLDTLLGR